MRSNARANFTLAYQYPDPEAAYVTLIGKAVITDDEQFKVAKWQPQSNRSYPGGPRDPNVVYVDFTAERIELWSSASAVVPN